jgi:hypothetical protein
MIIWITDDARRLPVRSRVNASVGKIEISIRSVGNAKTKTKTPTPAVQTTGTR